MPWLALTVEIDAAEVEALGDALLEGGAHSVSVDALEAERPSLTALVAADVDPAALLARAARASGLAAMPELRVSHVADEDWVRCSRAQFAPLSIGARLWVGASWHEPPAGVPAALRLDPGLAFGTGSHPSTRLVLRFLERTVRGGESLLDYGCGSGILAIAGAKLGAAHVDAVDLDAQALEATRANARANAVAVRVAAPESLGRARYDIVVSNILAQPLMLLAPLLASRTADRGTIALSGILESQAAEVARAYAGRFAMTMSFEEGWALLEGLAR